MKLSNQNFFDHLISFPSGAYTKIKHACGYLSSIVLGIATVGTDLICSLRNWFHRSSKEPTLQDKHVTEVANKLFQKKDVGKKNEKMTISPASLPQTDQEPPPVILTPFNDVEQNTDYFKLVSKNFQNEVFNSPIHNDEEKKMIYTTAREVYIYEKNLVTPNSFTEHKITLEYLRTLEKKHPSCHVLGIINNDYQWFDGSWKKTSDDGTKLIEEFRSTKIQNELPKEFPQTPWLCVRPLQVNGNHRTVFIIDFQTQTVEFFNSYNSDETVREQFQMIAGILTKRYSKQFTYLHKTRDYNLQNDAHQCGIWACKLAEERIMQGKDFNPKSLEDFNIAQFRQHVFDTNIEYRFHLRIGKKRISDYIKRMKPADALPSYLADFIQYSLTCNPSHNAVNHWALEWSKTGKMPDEFMSTFNDFKNLPYVTHLTQN